MDGPGKKRKPQACQYFGRLTFLTVQSNILLTLYHALRHARPESYIAVHAYPYAFAAGVGLTVNYYGLDHFLPEKIAEDKRWIAKGYTMIPVANHLEHGLALPTALLDAFYGGHAGQCTLRDVLVFVGGYTTFYNLFQLVNKRLTGAWLYPVFYEAETAVGAALGLLGRRDARVAVLLRARRRGARRAGRRRLGFVCPVMVKLGGGGAPQITSIAISITIQAAWSSGAASTSS